MNKNVITALAIAIVVVLGVAFRYQIKMFLFNGNQNKGQESPIPSFSFFPFPSMSETPFPSASASPQITPVSFQLPLYRGRPTEELHPSPDEVKLFSESDKQDLYRSLQNFGKTVKENPSFFNGWIQLGLLKKTIGDFEGARDALEYASLIRPENSVSFANLGELYWRYLRVYTQAEINFKTSIKNDPSDPGTYVSLSELYFYSLKEKSDLADDILLQGLIVNPQSMDITKALARLYEKSGQYAQAIEWWQKVLANDSTNADLASMIEGLKKKLPGQ